MLVGSQVEGILVAGDFCGTINITERDKTCQLHGKQARFKNLKLLVIQKLPQLLAPPHMMSMLVEG